MVEVEMWADNGISHEGILVADMMPTASPCLNSLLSLMQSKQATTVKCDISVVLCIWEKRRLLVIHSLRREAVSRVFYSILVNAIDICTDSFETLHPFLQMMPPLPRTSSAYRRARCTPSVLVEWPWRHRENMRDSLFRTHDSSLDSPGKDRSASTRYQQSTADHSVQQTRRDCHVSCMAPRSRRGWSP